MKSGFLDKLIERLGRIGKADPVFRRQFLCEDGMH